MDDQNPIPDAAEESLADMMDDAVPSRGYSSIPVVGLAASDGGTEALAALLHAIPAESGLAFVTVLHSDAEGTHEQLERALKGVGTLKVINVESGAKLEANSVYVAPPRRGVRAVDGAIFLTEMPTDHGNMVVDLFLCSLADMHGAHSAAVVLSGDAQDGATGIKRIKGRGGLTIAQDPEESQRNAMPRAAIGTGMVDWVLPVQDIPQRLLSYFSLEPKLKLPPEEPPQLADARPAPGTDETSLRDVLTFLRTRTGRDFGRYKRATILRRIARRMQVNGADTLPEYVHCLRTRPGEPGALLQDLLITVTNFFRDASCFGALEAQVPHLLHGKGPNDTVRVWVCACATGEEAYSVAMVLSEYARTLEAPPLIQIFATDLDESAIQTAREGIYPPSIEADVSEERLRRFFLKEHRGYRVRRELREMVLFAVHDVLKDSPFSRLDLVTCRNLLIYLNRDAQRRVFDIFHFALLAHGRLFLGSSESVEDGSPLFNVIDKKHRIYVQRAMPRVGLPVPTGPGTLALALEAQAPAREGPVNAGGAFEQAVHQRQPRDIEGSRVSSWGELHLRLLEHLAPPSVLVDGEYDIVHLSPSAGRFLQYSGGEPSRNLLRAVHPNLRIELRAALYQAAQSRSTVEIVSAPIKVGDEVAPLAVRVTPANDIGSDLFLVVMQTQTGPQVLPVPDSARADADPVAKHLDRELERLKTHLRDTVEQYEASTEELKASNEELQAMNEELRSATEELETSREELQSINEELTTVNTELKSKVDELGHANSDMHNLMDATAIATVFLDRDLRITRYTPSAVGLFNLIPTDVGRPLTDLTTQIDYPDLGQDARRVLDRLVPVEREVGQADGSWYLARLLPYRTIEDRIAGVVLSFVNITERKQAEEMRLWLSAVITSTADGIISFSLGQTILSWNGGAEQIFGYATQEAIGKPLAILAPPDRRHEQDEMIGRVGMGQQVQDHEVVRIRKDGSEVHVSLTISPIRDASGRVMAGTAIVRDVTAAKAAEAALRAGEEKLRRTAETTRAALQAHRDSLREIIEAARTLAKSRNTEGEGKLADEILARAVPLQAAVDLLLKGAE